MRACSPSLKPASIPYERIDEIPYMVVKKDGRRERFDRQKVLNGLMRACEKRISKLEQIVNEAESFVMESAERKTSEIGELSLRKLSAERAQDEEGAAIEEAT